MARYSFVVTILWIGFLVAIGFVETPLRFQPEQIDRIEALSIGHLVFHALNIAEILFASLLLAAAGLSAAAAGMARQNTLLGIVVSILLVQTLLLFTVLDWRTLAIINGQPVPEASYHMWYVGLDLVKLALLVLLTILQIRRFQRDCRDQASACR